MIYLFLAFVLAIQVVVFDFFGNRIGKDFWWNFNFILLVALAGFRWEVGGDSLTYQNAYENNLLTLGEYFSGSIFTEGWEPGFVFLMTLSKSLISEFWFFQIIHALIVNYVMFRFLRRYTTYGFLSLFIYYSFNYLYFNTEILREALAICVFVMMYEELKQKNIRKYYFLNIIAIAFHYSALILLIFPILSRLRLTVRNLFLFLLVGMLFPYLLQIVRASLSFLPFADRALGKLDTYLMYGLNLNGSIFNTICFILFPLLIIRLAKGTTAFKDLEILYMPYLFVAMIFVIHSGFGRFINYFIPFMMVGLSQVIFTILTFKRYRQVKFLFVLLAILPPFFYKMSYYFRSTDDLYPNTVVFNRWYPYSSVFEKESFSFRHILYQEGMRQSHERAINKEK